MMTTWSYCRRPGEESDQTTFTVEKRDHMTDDIFSVVFECIQCFSLKALALIVC